MSKQRIIVVGNGMVGHKFIDNLIQDKKGNQGQSNYDVITFLKSHVLLMIVCN
jgi:nitrite reductase (NADH) large subunit